MRAAQLAHQDSSRIIREKASYCEGAALALPGFIALRPEYVRVILFTDMFKRGFFNRGRIRSDEGFTITFVGRNRLVYAEGNRQVTIPGELLTDGFATDMKQINTWNDGTPFTDIDRSEVCERVRRALESQKMILDVG